MKILFFSRLFFPHIGGVEKHVYKLSKILIAKGHSVSVITEKYDEYRKEKEVHDGITIYRIPVKEGKYKKFCIWIWFIKHLNLILEADIIHCHDVFFWYLPFRILFPNRKVFVTFHGYEGYPLKKKDIRMHKISDKLSFGNISIGDFIPKWYRTKTDMISYGGVDLPKKQLLPKNAASAIFIGRLDQQTGIHMYNDAFKLIKKKNQDFVLTVVGDGPFREKLDKRIQSIGFITNPKDLLQEHRFAFVSRYLSILEAMAAKRLVFAVHDDPIKKDYLLLSPFVKFCIITNSAEELAKKVDYFLVRPKEEEKFIDLAYAWVKNQTWEEMTKMYLDLWKKK